MLITSTLFVICAVLIGIYMLLNNKKGIRHYPKWLPFLHFSAIGVGAVLVIWVAFLTYNMQLWINVIVAVIVTVLGFMLSRGKWHNSTRKTILAAHVAIASGCTLFLIYNTVFAV